MTDKALFIFTDGVRCSPVIALEEGGTDAPQWLKQLRLRVFSGMENPYKRAGVFCDILAKAHELFEIRNADDNLCAAACYSLFPAHVAHASALRDLRPAREGDAGLVVIDCRDGSWKAYGGYLDETAIIG